ncbi:hypothetical protein BDR06DRAFT_946625 [Suillus hirtellus]|nr:hypothetical protein BDR06DRAFT_946625 [Suillus hirtellus]
MSWSVIGVFEILDVLAEIPAVIRVNESSPDSTILLSSLHSISCVSNHNGVPAESTSSPGLAPVDSIFVVVRTIRCMLLAFVFAPRFLFAFWFLRV